jgi:hypothetical protein
MKINEVDPRNYDSDIDYYNALNAKPKARVPSEPRLSPAQQAADDEDAVSQQRQAAHSQFTKGRTVQYVDQEGSAPNGQKYNKLYVIHAKDSATAEHEEYLFDKHEWGAKKIIDVEKSKNEDGTVTHTMYIVDNHKYGMWKPWKDKPAVESVAEAEEDAFMSKLQGLKTWQVVIMNNYYRGKYPEYSGKYYTVLASSPEEAKKVVLDNADAILQELLASKNRLNGKKNLPRSTALPITANRIGKIADGTVVSQLTTAGYKKMFGPQGPMMVKLSGGAVQDIQGQEQGVAEGSTTMWEVSFDYGPHMSDTVKVKAGSEDEAIAKVEKAAEKRGRSIDINWAKPAEQDVAEGWDSDTTRLEQDVRDALENGDDYTAKQYAKMAPTPEAKKYLLNIIKQAMYIDDLGGETDWKGVAEGAPELLKAEMPLVRHIEQELTNIGYKKGTPEFNAYFNDAIKFYRQFGNFGFNKEQDVAEGLEHGNYNVGLEDIGKPVTVDGESGYVLLSIGYSSGNGKLTAHILQPDTGSKGTYDLETISKGQQGVAEGSLNEFAPDGFNGGDDGEEFNPRLAKMAYDEGVVKGVSLADGATLERAMAINDWDKHDGGIYKQHFAKGFKAGRMNKINHDNKQYNLNLKLMKDGSIRHGEQGVAEGSDNPTDVICVDVPLFIRLMEYAREDASSDMDLHNVAERLTQLSASGDTVSMNSYDEIVGSQQEIKEAVMNQVEQGRKNIISILKAAEQGQDAQITVGGEPITLEYPEARYVGGRYKAFMAADRQGEFLRAITDPVAFDRIMAKMRATLDKQKNFRGSVPGERGVTEGAELKQAKRKYNQAAKDANADSAGAGKKIDTMKKSLRQKDVDNKKDMAEGVAETMTMDEAKKVLRHHGADNFKTTSNELHFYKNGKPFTLGLTLGADGIRHVSLSSLNSATRKLKGQGVEEGVVDAVKSGAKKAFKALTGPDDEELIQRLEKETGGKRPEKKDMPQVKENEYYCRLDKTVKEIPEGYARTADGYITRK